MSLNRYEEDPEERAQFEHGVKVLDGGPLVAIAHFLGVAHQTAPPHGSYGKQCAVMANTLLDIAAKRQDAIEACAAEVEAAGCQCENLVDVRLTEYYTTGCHDRRCPYHLAAKLREMAR